MISKKVRENIIFALLLLWVIIGVLGVVYNTRKGFFEIREWGFLSQEDKKHKLFGDYYAFYKFLKANSNSEDIVLFTNDPMAFFLPRYFLYPQRIYWISYEKDFLSKLTQSKNETFFIYDLDFDLKDHIVVATFSAKSKKSGFFIKK